MRHVAIGKGRWSNLLDATTDLALWISVLDGTSARVSGWTKHGCVAGRASRPSRGHAGACRSSGVAGLPWLLGLPGALVGLGQTNSASPGSGSAAVRGINNGTGIYGWACGGRAPAQPGRVRIEPGRQGRGRPVDDWLGRLFDGDVQVTGTLTKGAGAFRIDDPPDPAHLYLQHSFVESPDMKNIYDGNVTTNGKGFATVTLPRILPGPEQRRDFRYQLEAYQAAAGRSATNSGSSRADSSSSSSARSCGTTPRFATVDDLETRPMVLAY